MLSCLFVICVVQPVMQMYSEYYSRFPVWYKSQFECKAVTGVQNAKRPGEIAHFCEVGLTFWKIISFEASVLLTFLLAIVLTPFFTGIVLIV